MYARVGRPPIAPEKPLRTQLLQMLYSICSERLLMEEMDYNLLFRRFVGLSADDEVYCWRQGQRREVPQGNTCARPIFLSSLGGTRQR